MIGFMLCVVMAETPFSGDSMVRFQTVIRAGLICGAAIGAGLAASLLFPPDLRLQSRKPGDVAGATSLTVAAERASTPGSIFKDCANCPEMTVLAAGAFMMGSPDGAGGFDEYPAHKVTIRAQFAVSRFEATFDNWDACVASGGCNLRPEDNGWGRGSQPVTNVSWSDISEYFAWLSKHTGHSYRLLTEAEWEYAARGGTTTAYAWGDDAGHGRANCKGCGSVWDQLQPAPVGSFQPNAFGLYDMLGNVAEWCEDAWHDDYNGAPEDGTAFGGGDPDFRVVRGGSWVALAALTRTAYREKSNRNERSYLIGFRVARDLLQASR